MKDAHNGHSMTSVRVKTGIMIKIRSIIAVRIYRYVITLELCSKYVVMVTIPDSWRESLRILVNMTSRCYAYHSCIACKHLIYNGNIP